ncbi:MAG: hypothetical protein AB1523_13010 [Bacillota bacterium]
MMPIDYDYAFRRIKTSSTGYRKIEATIRFANSISVDHPASAVYNYLGCEGSGFDFEFGLGFKPSAGYETVLGLFRSIIVNGQEDWAWIPGYSFSPGAVYRLLIATESGYIKCYVYNDSGAQLYYGEFNVPGARYDVQARLSAVCPRCWCLPTLADMLYLIDGQLH